MGPRVAIQGNEEMTCARAAPEHVSEGAAREVLSHNHVGLPLGAGSEESHRMGVVDL